MILGALSFIFGGCCFTAYTLEAIVREYPKSGLLITFSQFVFITIEGLLYFLIHNPSVLKNPNVPRKRWLSIVLLFFSINVLNNIALGFDVSVPVHIILRSSGPLTTMAVGWMLANKSYTIAQMISVVILTLGVVIAVLGNAQDIHVHMSSTTNFAIGFSILMVTQLLGAFMGLLLEDTYKKYKTSWRESLFYTHAFSIPFFLPLLSSIRKQWMLLFTDSENSNLELFGMPPAFWYLCLNTLAQYVCVRGVNSLGSQSSALTVTIILNVRKFVSLCLSILLFGNRLSGAVVLGACLVFGSSATYVYSRPAVKSRDDQKDEKKDI
ncbi:NST UDP-N-acetylglucosamine transporter [Schizosaccharomyces cryophilus OY26]|uniref:NST UDP-N-acetylglucosamine transporter n=1 Tax=Schizosaccharomyces cryophilus (strain OY26 / ATCC MYA-4695 / CBS 11777 / NBRC 106824 / NRRL Y48691) TaxID=653667 RepID=S9VN90_SCHCR|nr:NST UDP-N-acetylglucosamine transporter [Schizosaccharomyces cryophilus OY26]EPY49403.1 NST UDP-N-acetylglucosamine transporter [Schizosaccharomyces cryophilus OY26]